jgi:hypothetical protein
LSFDRTGNPLRLESDRGFHSKTLRKPRYPL